MDALCDSSNFKVQLSAASALCYVAAANSQLEALVSTRALPTLLHVLKRCQDGDDAKKAYADMASEEALSSPTDNHSRASATATADTHDSTPKNPEGTQIAVLHTLHHSLHDPSNRAGMMLALHLASGVPDALVALLSSEISKVQLGAIYLLSTMMDLDNDTALNIAAAGAIPALISLLHSSEQDIYEAAAATLVQLLTEIQDNKEAFVAESGLDALAILLKLQGKQPHAMALLRALVSGSSSMQSAAGAAGIIQPVVQLLHGADKGLTVQAMATLSSLVSRSNRNQAAVAAAGAVPLLVSMLGADDAELQWKTASVLLDLVINNNSKKAAVAAAKGVEATVKAMSSPDAMVQLYTVTLLRTVVGSHSRHQSAAITAGAIPAIVSILKHGSVAAQTAAAGALANLAIPTSNLSNLGAMEGPPGMAMMGSSIEVTRSNVGPWHAAAEAVPLLVARMKEDNIELQRAAAGALCNMFTRSSAITQAFEAADGPNTAASMLMTGNTTLQQAAALLLRNYHGASSYGRLG